MTKAEVETLITAYLSNTIDLEKLYTDLIVDKYTNERVAQNLSNNALLIIFEYQHGDWTEEELRNQLRYIVRNGEFPEVRG